MSAKIAVLGLVIEEPGPPHRLTAKLRQRLASAEFVDSNVYSALARLERDGFVRAVEDGDATTHSAMPATRRGVPAGGTPPRQALRRTPGGRAEARVFEATPAGVQHFEEWLLGSSAAPPLRDELHMKVALCQPQNLPRLIELVYGQELVCLGRVQELRRSFQRMQPPKPDRWSGMVLVHVRDAELSFWDARLTWLQGVRESLERMHAAHGEARRRYAEA
jgi:DNA-binding PadR family transcriptional regulator